MVAYFVKRSIRLFVQLFVGFFFAYPAGVLFKFGFNAINSSAADVCFALSVVCLLLGGIAIKIIYSYWKIEKPECLK